MSSSSFSSMAIPTFYRIWFTTVDPIFSLFGILTALFLPTTMLTSFSPTPTIPPTTETVFLLDQTAAFLTGLTFLQIYLFRAKPTDMVVWRAVQTSILLVDLGMLGGIARGLAGQGRLEFESLRLEEWGNLVIIGNAALVRITFLLGVGMGSRGRGKGKGKRA
ncbi:MAG: hypothetical protein MMC33_001740 [Icmadophila ericetorum]|nr:hypothetical protein [Icmadophila ericetorum]